MKKTVIVTGASSGIGKATALHLAAKGARLVLGARGEDQLRSVAQQIEDLGGEAVFATVDVAQRAGLNDLVNLAQRSFGRLDVFVSNAGAMPIGPLADLAVDDWERMVDVNVKGLLWSIAAALPVFREQGCGHFITIASTAARKLAPNMAVYAGTKAAAAVISEGLRQEMAGQMRVTTIFPGYTATAFADHVPDPTLREQMKRAGSALAMAPEAVAAAVAYAMEQPEEVNLGEIIIRSTVQA